MYQGERDVGLGIFLIHIFIESGFHDDGKSTDASVHVSVVYLHFYGMATSINLFFNIDRKWYGLQNKLKADLFSVPVSKSQ